MARIQKEMHTVLKESQVAAMEEFLDNIKILINALGYKVLEPLRQVTSAGNGDQTDNLQLPECIINEVPVMMSEKEMAVYDEFREEMVAQIKDKEIDAANAAVLSGKLLQMANGAVYDEDKKTVVIHDRKHDF